MRLAKVLLTTVAQMALIMAMATAMPSTPPFSRVQNFWQNGEWANWIVATCILAHLSVNFVMESACALEPGRRPPSCTGISVGTT